MLPPSCLIGLVQVFNASDFLGLPAHLMRARVIALAKEPGTQDPSKTRPITIMAMVYRVWAKVTTSIILEAWADVMPRSISGFLPGRSALFHQYELQFLLEQAVARHEAVSWGGLTLDIRKAFNCLPRLPCKHIMLKLGVPAQWIDVWYESLNKLARTWQIGKTYTEFDPGTTGVPEGDPWSVAIMVGVNAMLDALLKLPTLVPHLFADNWSYRASDPSIHQEAIEVLLQFTKSLKLQIDWSKTWCWTTSAAHRQAYVDAASQHVSLDRIPEQLHAKDLGFKLHYRCKQFRQPQSQRHQETLERLNKLQKQEFDLQTKAVIIMTACLPKALYGTCLYAAGEKWFDELRAKIGRALVGNHHNVNPYLACSILSKKIIDPEYFAIRQALLTARDFLHQTEDQTRQIFLAKVSHSNANPTSIMGPAAALQFYISKLGWLCDRAGALSTSLDFPIHLLHSPVEVLDLALQHSWMEKVSLEISSRKGMRHAPVIDRPLTVKTLLAQPGKAQKALALQMVGGYMTNHQKHHFSADQSLLCEFCQEPDSVPHQVVWCPATQVIRDEHPQAMEFLREHDSIYAHLPVVFRHPFQCLSLTMQHMMPEPIPTMPPLLSCFFTDGSCQFPADGNARCSAYAIVAPTVPLESLDQYVSWPTQALLEQFFQVVAVAFVTGFPNIDRAELQAVVLAHEQHTEQPVYTDSAYVISCHRRVLKTSNKHRLHKYKHADLLFRWHDVVWNHHMQTPTYKVKAHQLRHTSAPEVTRLTMGNEVADWVAKQTLRTLTPEYLALQKQIHDEQGSYAQALHHQFKMRTDLSNFRQALLNTQFVEDAQPPHSTLHKFQHWTVVNPRINQTKQVDTLELEDAVHASAWGVMYTDCLLQWLEGLQWPDGDIQDEDPGISWLELLVNFEYLTQQTVPLLFPTAEFGKQYRHYTDVLGWTRSQCNLHDYLYSFQASISHVSKLLDLPLLPDEKSKVRSVYQLGAGAGHRGIARRPVMQHQPETMNLVDEFLTATRQSTNNARKTVLPDIPMRDTEISQRFFPLEGDTPDQRHRRYLKRITALKERKNAAT
eukprot:Skav207071  [mRNA]  locus=scaffold1909:182710:185898:- [translate_table: standard]